MLYVLDLLLPLLECILTVTFSITGPDYVLFNGSETVVLIAPLSAL
jgi:hypothetical protein